MFGNAIYSTGAKPGCRSAHHGDRHGHGHGHGFAFGPRGDFGPFGGFGPGFGGGGGGPRGRGRRARRGDIRTAALLLLAEEPRNGYQIMQEVQERSGGIWSPSPGSVYPALSQLEDEGLIRTEESDGRKLFAITDAGRALVDERGADRPAPWEQSGDAAGEMHELGKLMREVASAFVQVMRTGSGGQMASARDVLANTRRDLYRILADGDVGGGAAGGDSGDGPDAGADAGTVDKQS
ncbi:MAG TPA: PadR family transcriptional regulator [Solirubrobacteraceae bacterium]|jgi:DNA-binding PadR family transcriptional regulator|nr:PadR family transcriptional regulator [Solirubrobacteraceae bacterium]